MMSCLPLPHHTDTCQRQPAPPEVQHQEPPALYALRHEGKHLLSRRKVPVPRRSCTIRRIPCRGNPNYEQPRRSFATILPSLLLAFFGLLGSTCLELQTHALATASGSGGAAVARAQTVSVELRSHALARGGAVLFLDDIAAPGELGGPEALTVADLRRRVAEKCAAAGWHTDKLTSGCGGSIGCFGAHMFLKVSWCSPPSSSGSSGVDDVRLAPAPAGSDTELGYADTPEQQERERHWRLAELVDPSWARLPPPAPAPPAAAAAAEGFLPGGAAQWQGLMDALQRVLADGGRTSSGTSEMRTASPPGGQSASGPDPEDPWSRPAAPRVLKVQLVCFSKLLWNRVLGCTVFKNTLKSTETFFLGKKNTLALGRAGAGAVDDENDVSRAGTVTPRASESEAAAAAGSKDKDKAWTGLSCSGRSGGDEELARQLQREDGAGDEELARQLQREWSGLSEMESSQRGSGCSDATAPGGREPAASSSSSPSESSSTSSGDDHDAALAPASGDENGAGGEERPCEEVDAAALDVDLLATASRGTRGGQEAEDDQVEQAQPAHKRRKTTE